MQPFDKNTNGLLTGKSRTGRTSLRASRYVVAALVAVCGIGTLLPSCSNIDCPLDNVVRMQCNLYLKSPQSAYTLNDELTITPAGRDTVLLNKASGIKSFLLPLKEGETKDTLLLHWANADGLTATDTLFVDHTLQPHFESLDCPSSVFHTITSVRATSHSLSEMPFTVDSVSVVRTLVNYDDVENIRIFLRTASSK